MHPGQPLTLRRVRRLRIEHGPDERDRQIHELLVSQIALRLDVGHWGSLVQPQSSQRTAPAATPRSASSPKVKGRSSPAH
jgi:hypothetical protein